MIEDATKVYSGEDKPWIPLPGNTRGESWIKVIHTDSERGVVIFKFRFSPDCEVVPHTHKCHAIAYTLWGEWEYEGSKLAEGAVAYEPVGSRHTPASGPGAEIVTFLTSETNEFLINHLPDGSELAINMGLFRQLEAVRTDGDLERITAFLSG